MLEPRTDLSLNSKVFDRSLDRTSDRDLFFDVDGILGKFLLNKINASEKIFPRSLLNDATL